MERILLDNLAKLREKELAGVLLLDKTPPKFQTYRELRDYIFETYNYKQFQGISITYKPQYQNSMTQGELKELLQVSLQHRIPCEKYILIPDVDKQSNFHYHGIIDIDKASMHNFKIWMTKNIGFMKYSYITQLGGWIAYMLKNKPTQSPIYTPQEISRLMIEYKDDDKHYERTQLHDFYDM